MTDPNQRRMNWQIKTDTGKVKQILDDRRPDMLKRYEAAVASLCEMGEKRGKEGEKREKGKEGHFPIYALLIHAQAERGGGMGHSR